MLWGWYYDHSHFGKNHTWEKWSFKRSCHLLQVTLLEGRIPSPSLRFQNPSWITSLYCFISLWVHYVRAGSIFEAKCRSESCWRCSLVLRMEVNPSRARSTHGPSVGALFWIQNPPQNSVPCHEVAIKDEALFPFLASRMRFKHPHAAKSCWSALPTFNFSHSSPTLFQGAVLQAHHTQFSRMPCPSS